MRTRSTSSWLRRTIERAVRVGDAASALICERPSRVIGLLGLVAVTALTAHVSRIERGLMHETALRTAAQYANAVVDLRTVYGEAVADRAATLPTPEALASQIGARMAQHEAGGTVRTYSPYHVEPGERSAAPTDRFLRAAWRYLASNPYAAFHRVEAVNGRMSVRYAIAQLVDEECDWCAAAGLERGTASALLEVVVPVGSAVDLARKSAWNTFVPALLATGLGVLLLSFLVSRLKANTDAARKLAEERARANEALIGEVAQRTRAEAELAVANDRLTANHTTLEQWAAELEIAHTRLRDVDELKTKFLSEVSHELRSPMAAIVSAAKIITKYYVTKPEVVERFGATIVSEGARMTRLINDFLDLTKVESGCVDWNDAEVELGSLVSDALHGMDSLALEGGIRLEQEIEPDLPRLRVDRDRIFQVLTNLSNNAIKFTPEGGTVRLCASLSDGDLLFSVDDTGPGIPPEELSKVFDRFHQVKAKQPDGKQARGTGLGLCIAREIVEHYGGRIWVESELGKGSSFRFTIPMDGSHRQVVSATSSRSGTTNSQRVRVALVLEDFGEATSAANHASENGLDCRPVSSLDDMASLGSAWRPDVLVLSAGLAQHDDGAALRRAGQLGISKVLLHSPEHGLTAPSILDSANLLVPSLKSLVAPGACVLVADDDEKYRSILEFELRQAGYRICAAESGQEALELAVSSGAEAMILDLVMPGVDGLTVLERLRRSGCDMPVLVYTALDDPNVALTAKQLGATEVFRKDGGGQASYAAVAARVSRVLAPVLDRRRARDASA